MKTHLFWRHVAVIGMYVYVLSCCLTQATAVSTDDTIIYNRPAIQLDNGYVQLVVTPEIGGRVLLFATHDGDNVLNVSRHNIHRSPDDQWQGAEYGGIADAATRSWPGDFWGLTYDLDTSRDHDTVAVRVSAEAGGVKVERDMTLLPESTACRLDITHTNTADQSLPVVIRTHCEYAIGTCADDTDLIVYAGKDGLVELPYRLGWENPRMSFEHPTGGWIACVDQAERIALVRRFLTDTDNVELFFWRGHNEGGPVRDECGGFYSLDRFMQPVSLQPGKSISQTEELFIINGLPRVDMVADQTAVAVLPDKLAYGPRDTAKITIMAGAAHAGGPYTVQITADLDDDTAQTKTSGYEVILPAHEAGKASASEMVQWSLSTSRKIQCRIVTAEGEAIGTIGRKLTVDEAAWRESEDAIVALEKTRLDMLATLKEMQDTDRPTVTSLQKLADWYLATARQLFDQGRYAEAAERARTGSSTLSSVSDIPYTKDSTQQK